MKRTEIYDRHRFVFLCTTYKKLVQRTERHLDAFKDIPYELLEDYNIQFSVLMDERKSIHRRILRSIPKDYDKAKWYFSVYDEIIESLAPIL